MKGMLKGMQRGEPRPTVLVIDFGGQYAHLIARRIRELGVFSVLSPAAWGLEYIKSIVNKRRIAGIILSGGPSSVWEENHDEIALWALSLGVPVLGICYGHQLLAKVLKGRVGKAPRGEFGPTKIEVLDEDVILRGHGPSFIGWMSHNDAVLEAPPDVKVLARSPGSPVAAFSYRDLVFGVQWHPEVIHSEHGDELFRSWLELTGALGTWSPVDLIGELVEYVSREIGGEKAVAAVSGGIDSTVAAIIAKKALGNRLIPVFIDHGLHPEGEVENALRLLRRVGLDPIVIDASDEFLEALSGITDPEEKRRIVGRLYGQILEREALSLGASYLIQGTIYPDVIESGARPGADVIKTHHNVGGLPQLRIKVVEPLKWLYKDEVRAIARKLGLPLEIWKYKQPIPGPGLAVRIEGEVTREKLAILRKADSIVREEIERHRLHDGLWQYFAILTASRATGVKGDRRAYGYVVAVRILESRDAMTARPARIPWDILETIAARITGEIPEVVRVVYDITPKPPATIEWE